MNELKGFNATLTVEEVDMYHANNTIYWVIDFLGFNAQDISSAFANLNNFCNGIGDLCYLGPILAITSDYMQKKY